MKCHRMVTKLTGEQRYRGKRKIEKHIVLLTELRKHPMRTLWNDQSCVDEGDVDGTLRIHRAQYLDI